MAVEITGGCYHCSRLCSNSFEHPVPDNPGLCCDDCYNSKYSPEAKRRIELENLIGKEEKSGKFWKWFKK